MAAVDTSHTWQRSEARRTVTGVEWRHTLTLMGSHRPKASFPHPMIRNSNSSGRDYAGNSLYPQ